MNCFNSKHYQVLCKNLLQLLELRLVVRKGIIIPKYSPNKKLLDSILKATDKLNCNN